MIRFSLAFMLVVCAITSCSIIFAQDDFENQGATVRGQIVDTTVGQNPIEGVEVKIVATNGEEYTAITDANGDYEKSGIPTGRYLISIYKKGYGDRIGKPITVFDDGGDYFVPLKMTKKNNIVTFLQGSVPMYWALIFLVLIIILIFSLTNRS